MTPAQLKEVVIESLSKLCENDYLLIESSVKEECINHKFAQYIEYITKQSLPHIDVDVDVEYNKYEHDPKKMMGQTPIRPDIIVHKRQSGNSNNYLAIEAKKEYSSKHDKEKIEHLVLSENFNYSLGCLVSYQPDREYLIIQFLVPSSNDWEKLKYRKQPFEIL
ncbi:MAG: hypothetical protein D9V46_12160 [Deltaproteobacteria bacterium]|jgi:hypothetical protein|uniref:hypothetical protein n=1 Tax=Hydrosulfovibrio ferrireducens TaxID=2934181 RepID=UPI0011FCA6CE|nr:MAG: hypothetical protein D9V46_12160 [Deltaproteobacteria bacterium]